MFLTRSFPFSARATFVSSAAIRLRNVGARAGRRDRDHGGGEFSVLSRILDRHAESGRRPRDDLWAARRRSRDWRLSARSLRPASETTAEVYGDAFPAPQAKANSVSRALRQCSSSARTITASDEVFVRSFMIRTGSLMHTGADEWIWRPLRNPTATRSFRLFLDIPKLRLRASAKRDRNSSLSRSRSRL